MAKKNKIGLEILPKLKAKVNLKNCKQVAQTHFAFTIWGQKCIVSVLLKFKWIVTHLSCFSGIQSASCGTSCIRWPTKWQYSFFGPGNFQVADFRC